MGLVNDEAAYVLFVYGHSAAPRFNLGERVLVNPKRPPAIGDDVAIRMKVDKKKLLGGGDESCISILSKKIIEK